MFVGGIPAQALREILRLVASDVKAGRPIYVACSGSYRIERALCEKFPGVQIHSNDVSLVSVAIGRYLTSTELGFKFTGDLEFLEECCIDEEARLSALFFAVKLSSVISRRNEFFKMRFETYVRGSSQMIESGRTRVKAIQASVKIASFSACDWLDHVKSCNESEGVLVGFPPTYKGGYEKLYKAIDANVEWQAPSYDMFDPASLEGVIDGFRAQHAYVIGTDQRFDDREDMIAVVGNHGKKNIYLYHGSPANSRVAGILAKRKQIRSKYTPVVMEKLTRDSQVCVAAVDREIERRFAEHYLSARNLNASGARASFAVTIDGMLAGFFCFNELGTLEGGAVLLIRDYSLVPNSRLSKLIVMLAKAERVVRLVDRLLLQKDSETVVTAVFSQYPESMKYRGVFKKASSKQLRPDYYHLRYEAPLDPRGFNEIYQDWFRRYFANQQSKSQPEEPSPSGKKRAKSDRAGVPPTR